MAKVILEKDALDKINLRFERLKADRVNWEPHWRDIVTLVNPRLGTQYNEQTRGEKRMTQVFDTAPIHANQMLANSLHSRLTNPAVQWFGLTTGSYEVDIKPEVTKYLQDSVRSIHEVLNQTNFQSKLFEYYSDLTSLCTAVLLCEEDDTSVLRFATSPIWNHWVDAGHTGDVDTVFTCYEMTLRQILQKFGKEPFANSDIHRRTFEELTRAPDTARHKVIHGAFPRSDRDITKAFVTNKPVASVYYLQKGLIPLANTGFDFNPYIVSRYSVNSNELYGRGPGTLCLPDARVLNTMVFTHLRFAQKMTDPPLLVPDDGYLKSRTYPGATIPYRAGTQDRPDYLVPSGNPNITLQFIERIERKIGQTFHIDQLQLVQSDRMTATEVSSRNDEMMTLMSPVLARQHNEFLKPLIDRCFLILNKRGLLPQAPQEILGSNLNIEYTSQIAKAQKRASAANVQQFMNVLAPFMQIDPRAQKIVDGEKVARYISRQMDIPQDILRQTEDIDESLREEAELMEQAERAKIAQTQAQADNQNLQNEQLVRSGA